MSDEITVSQPKSIGRPTVMTDIVVGKLEEIFRLGCKDAPACAYAGISRDTFYSWLKDNDDFSDRIETAKNYAIIASRQIVVSKIIKDHDLETAKWYLERHDTKQPQTQNQTQVNVFNQLREEFTKPSGEAIADQVDKDLIEQDPVTEVEVKEAVATLDNNETK